MTLKEFRDFTKDLPEDTKIVIPWIHQRSHLFVVTEFLSPDAVKFRVRPKNHYFVKDISGELVILLS